MLGGWHRGWPAFGAVRKGLLREAAQNTGGGGGGGGAGAGAGGARNWGGARLGLAGDQGSS